MVGCHLGGLRDIPVQVWNYRIRLSIYMIESPDISFNWIGDILLWLSWHKGFLIANKVIKENVEISYMIINFSCIINQNLYMIMICVHRQWVLLRPVWKCLLGLTWGTFSPCLLSITSERKVDWMANDVIHSFHEFLFLKLWKMFCLQDPLEVALEELGNFGRFGPKMCRKPRRPMERSYRISCSITIWI